MTKIARVGVLVVLGACGGGSGAPDGPRAPDATTDGGADAGADAADLRTLTIARAGGGAGFVTVEGAACALPCTRAVAPGTVLHLAAFTPSVVGGWSGACTSAGATCTVTVDADATATIALTPDTGEQWTAIVPGVPLERVVATSDGGLIVAGHDATSHELVAARFTMAGAPTWLVRFPSVAQGAAVGLAADAAGGAVVLDYQPPSTGALADVVVRDLGAAGAVTWTDTIAHARWYGAGFAQLGDAAAATATGGVVVALATATGGLVRSYDPAGTIQWTQTPALAPLEVAIASTGVVHVMLDDGAAYATLARWSATGAPLADLTAPAPGPTGAYYETLAIDAADQLLLTGVPSPELYRLRALALAGATAWTAPDAARDDGAGVVATPGGGAVVLDTYLTLPSKFALTAYTAAGVPGTPRIVTRDLDALYARAAASLAADQTVVAGVWLPDASSGAQRDGFVRRY
jgi:hypothetical protein